MSNKSKFVLTTDLVKVEPEPIQSYEGEKLDIKEQKIFSSNSQRIKKTYLEERQIGGEGEKDQLSLKIDRTIKRNFQMWCVKNNKTMTQAIEEAISMYIKK